jgi:hypothetical protein
VPPALHSGMADLDDIPFDSGPARPPASPTPGPPVWPMAGAAVLLVVLGALWYFGTRDRPPAPATTTKPVEQTTVELPRRAGEPGDKIDLPPLDQTDTLVRTLAGKLSSHPAVTAWLTTNGLLRNAVVVIANIADGETPAKHLAPLKPQGAFSTKTANGLTWIDPVSYRRYDAIGDAVDGLDARGVARLYATLKPRVDDAYHDLVGAQGDFDKTLERAIVALLKTPSDDGDVQLTTGKMSYAYASPGLEGLTAAQRQLLRMGPRNARIVKAKLRAVAGFLGIPEAALPPA